MTENKSGMDKERLDKRSSKKLKQLRKKRLIIRNLSFKVSEEELKKLFSQFGEVLDVNIPVNDAGKKRGFAFVQYADTKSQIRAMKELNFKKINGRAIAIDFAMDKTTYQSQQNNLKCSDSKRNDALNESQLDLEDSEEDDIKLELQKDCSINAVDVSDTETTKVKAFLKEFDADNESLENSENEMNSESSEDDDDNDELENSNSDDDDSNTNIKNKPLKKKHSDDVSEGKTVFIRNISFKNTEEDLQELVKEYGEIVYCLLCVDPLTDHFKGTAFVKFKEKESADKFIEESSKEPGILLDGRRLLCTHAVSREELSKKHDGPEKVKDKRNLRLLKCGLIAYGSKEAEGVSQADLSKRAQLEIVKKKKLKNVNFFISDKRLVCHNLPKNINDKDLYIMFKKAGGKGAVVKEARVMRDFKKTDAQGIPVSRGFGFVSFTEPEHALKALMELNNNPKIFTSSKRPIVEFSVEDKVALLSQERRREKIKMRNKKISEQKTSVQVVDSIEQKLPQLSSFVGQKRKKLECKSDSCPSQKRIKQKKSISSSKTALVKKQKKHSRRKKNTKDVQNGNNLSVLTNKYKEKLLNKSS